MRRLSVDGRTSASAWSARNAATTNHRRRRQWQDPLPSHQALKIPKSERYARRAAAEREAVTAASLVALSVTVEVDAAIGAGNWWSGIGAF